MRLAALLEDQSLEGSDPVVTGLAIDHRKVAPGNVFVLGGQLCQQRGGQLGDCTLAKTFEVLGVERGHIVHDKIPYSIFDKK